MKADDWTLKLQMFCSTLDRILDFPVEDKACEHGDRRTRALSTLEESSESAADSSKAVNPVTEGTDNTGKHADLTEESVLASSAPSPQLSTHMPNVFLATSGST
eukprot:scpid84855/ scgid13883/ 